MNNFSIVIPRKMWTEGEHSEALIPLLVAYGPFQVDQYTSIPEYRLVPTGTDWGRADPLSLPFKKWRYDNGKITFETHKTGDLAYAINLRGTLCSHTSNE